MTALRKTGYGCISFSWLRLVCMGILMLLSDTRPLAMPLQLKLGAVPAGSGNSVYYSLIGDVNKRAQSAKSASGMKIENKFPKPYYKLADETKATERKQRLQEFYIGVLRYCFQANDTDGVFYCMEQIKLLRLTHSLENDKLEPITIFKLQQQLRVHNLQYLNYVEADGVIYTILITADKVDCRKIDFADYNTALKELMAICADKEMLNKQYNRYAQLSILLYKKIVEPLKIAEGRLLIAQGDPLLPFEALATDSTGNDFLLYHYSICYTYAATWYFRPQSIRVGSTGFLGIAPEYYSPVAAQTQLHGSVESLQKIEDLFSIHNTLTWSVASKQNFLETAAKYSVLHIYTHAEQENGRPVLYMHDKPVDMFDIGLLKNNSQQLVFLAACATAVMNDEKNPTSYSLADNFINAGASSVIGTLWLAETQTMYSISEVFYRLLEQGLPKDEALRQAKIQFIKREVKPNQLPYYWACVVLLGNAEPLIPAAEGNASICLTALINIAVCAVWKMAERTIC